MYHCKIARTEKEFTAIARLNYETFVEEIPQHPPNAERLLVDKFHNENTYIVLYKDEQLIGMLAFRDKRPFSIDMKIGKVEHYLPAHVCEKMCEVRLLAIKKEYRVGRVFLRLAQALYAYIIGENYTACVISGVTSQELLYKHIGFSQFTEAMGDEHARFLPMVLTSEDGHAFYRQFQQKHAIFYPGPVQQIQPLQYTTVSHRSGAFQQLLLQLKTKLLELSDAQNVALVHGSGTVANDMMLSQLKNRFGQQRGLICINGEFGRRLAVQAIALGLQFDVYEETLGQAFDQLKLEQYVRHKAWCVFVHGETSTGMLNDLNSLIDLKLKYEFTLAVDCISSFGAVPFSLQHVDLASATSGKAIGAMAGLSFLFYKGDIVSGGPVYLDLTHYDHRTPFTLPAYLVGNVVEQLAQYPARYDVLQQRLQTLLQITKLKFMPATHYPTAVSFQSNDDFVMDAQLNGIEIHAQSKYLQASQMGQISVIQPNFEKDIQTLLRWLSVYEKVVIENNNLERVLP